MQQDQEFSFKSLFVPFTTLKAIHWIIFIGIVVYANMLFNGFVWDDVTYFANNVGFQTLKFNQLFGVNLFNIAGQYRPIPAFYFYTLYHIFGNTTFFYHVLQLLTHIVNALLVFFLLNHFIKRKYSFVLSLIFLVHPTQVESVSYIAASDYPIYFFFGMVALFFYFKDNMNYINVFVIPIFLLLSLLTNEASIVFFIAIILYTYLFAKKNLNKVLPLVGLPLALYFAIRFYIEGIYFATKPAIPIATLSLYERLLNVPAIVLYYIKTFVLPLQLNIDQQWIITHINVSNFYIPLILDIAFFLIICIIGIYIYRFKNNFKAYLFFLLWFVIGLLPYLQIIPLDETVADRWFYFPIVGLLGMVGTFLCSVHIRNKKIKIVMLSLVIVLLLFFSIRTMIRNINWNSYVSIFTHDAQTQDNYDMEVNLGSAYLLLGNDYEALVHYQKSAEIFPNEVNLHDIGTEYRKLGNFNKAEEYYYKALSTKNVFQNGHKHILQSYTDLAFILLLSNRYKEAKDFITTKALVDYPNSGFLWIELAASEYKLNNKSASLVDANKAKMLSPNDPIINNIYYAILNNQPVTINQ